MRVTFGTSLAILYLATTTAASGPTKIYIDSVPEYDLLQTCAEHQVSVIVRAMSYGCGDGSQITSYACFCYKSSAYYSRMISTRVASACAKTRGQDSSAVEVFSRYCELGDVEKVTTTETEPSSEPTPVTSSIRSRSASPASTPAKSSASSTSSPPSNDTFTNNNNRITAISVGVTVPVLVIALGLVGFSIYLHRRRQTPRSELPAQQVHEKDSYRYEHEADTHQLHEMGTSVERGEMAGSTFG